MLILVSKVSAWDDNEIGRVVTAIYNQNIPTKQGKKATFEIIGGCRNKCISCEIRIMFSGIMKKQSIRVE